MDWYPWHFELYANDTMHLTCLQDGAYRRLIDHYMKTRQALPDDDRALANITRLGLADWQEIAGDVRAFFKPRNGKLYQTRCEQTLSSQEKGSTTRSETAKKAAEARWLKEKEKNAQSMLEASSEHARAMLGDARGEERIEEKNIHTPRTAKRAETRARARAIPSDFVPDETTRAHFARLGLDPDQHLSEFLNFWTGSGGTKVDWQATYRNRGDQIAERRRQNGNGSLFNGHHALRKVSRVRAIQVLKDAGMEGASPPQQRQLLVSKGFDPESLKG